jgi:hypothetical protein
MLERERDALLTTRHYGAPAKCPPQGGGQLFEMGWYGTQR